MTLGSQYAFTHSIVDAGQVFGMLGGKIYSVFSGSQLMQWQYTTGRITAGLTATKFFEAVRFKGTGTIAVSVLVDGASVVGSDVDLDSASLLDQYVYLPNAEETDAIQVEIVGSGEVRSITCDLYDAETEAR